MSFGRAIKLVIIALATLGLLLLLSQFMVSRDFSEPIANGYDYVDAGGYEKMIVYSGNQRPPQIIIGSRVDEYRIDSDKLFVARKPVESFMVGDVLKSKILDVCEYWVVNVKTNQVGKVTDSSGLHCN